MLQVLHVRIHRNPGNYGSIVCIINSSFKAQLCFIGSLCLSGLFVYQATSTIAVDSMQDDCMLVLGLGLVDGRVPAFCSVSYS